MRAIHYLAALAAVGPVWGTQPQWRVVLLEPPGVYSSSVAAAGRAYQAGYLDLPGVLPVLWEGSAESFIDLTPAGWGGGQAYGADNYFQVGQVLGLNASAAALWSGTADSFINLSPGGVYLGGRADAVCGGQQVGSVNHGPSNNKHACLWHGSAASFVDLHPPTGVRWSEALATDGTLQGGYGLFEPGWSQAILWHGTAESFVNMSPPGTASRIRSMAAGVQAGYATFLGSDHAALWRGTPQSFVDLHPPGARNSKLYATTGTLHGGYVSFTGSGEACLWLSDDPEDLVNLHVYLGPGWFGTVVNCISIHQGRIYAGGSGARNGENAQAILWIGRLPRHLRPRLTRDCPAPGCETDLNGDCTVALDDLAAILSAFGSSWKEPDWDDAADFDDDGAIGLGDFALLLAEFGNRCE